MRISDNRLQSMQDYYHRELDASQGVEETQALFELAVDHFLKLV